MKLKKIYAFIIACIVFLCGCTMNNDTIPEMKVNASKYVDLPSYENYVIEQESLFLSEEELNSIILFNLSYNEIYKKVEDRYLLSVDDIANIDFEIYIDEELYLSESDYNYFMGSNQLTEDFEKNILNQQIKTEKQFIVDFPDDYQDASLASKTANITVYLDFICKLTDISDEEIIISHYDCSSMNEVYELIQEQAAEKMIFDHVINKIFEEVHIISFPPQGTAYVDEIISDYKNEAIQLGITWDDYLNNIQETEEDVLRAEIENFYMQFLVVKAMTETEKIEYTMSDFDAQVDILSETDDISREEVLECYDPVSICYEMMLADLENVIPLKTEIKF